MANYNVKIWFTYDSGIYSPVLHVTNNENYSLELYNSNIATNRYERVAFPSKQTGNWNMFSFNVFTLHAPAGGVMKPIFIYLKIPTNTTIYSETVFYIDQTGKPNLYTTTDGKTLQSISINGLSDTISPGGLSTLHIDDTRVEQINYNNKSYTSFPVDIPLVPNVKTMTVIGKTFNVQLDNELNIVRVKDGQTEYRQFPATIMVGENKTLQLYGKEDPEITIDYTGTQDPVISNTPATPPPVV